MKQAMILAAGRGERMLPLTAGVPKPLLEAGGRTLLEYHLEKLAASGIGRVVINHARYGEQIEARYGNGRSLGLEILYSAEGETPLETGGGIKNALPLLGEQPFIVVNADIWTDFDFGRLPVTPAGLAHLVLVGNPEHHAQGDFALADGLVAGEGAPKYTYSGIGVYLPELFAECREEVFPLAPVLFAAAGRNRITGELYEGRWVDVGTPERLALLDRQLKSRLR